jgi:hypothetical protein
VGVICATALAPALAQNKPLKDQIDELRGRVTQETLKEPGARDALGQLLDQALRLDCTLNPATKVDCSLDQLETLVDAWNAKFVTTPLAEPQQAKLGRIITTLIAIERRNETAAAVAHATRLDATLGDLSQIDTASKELASAIVNLKKKLARITPTDPRINVVGAWFGDIHAVKAAVRRHGVKAWLKGARFCPAIRAVRRECQGKVKCFEPPTGDGGNAGKPSENITGTALCGYEPAPFADERVRGLVVLYECVTRDIETWKTIGGELPKVVGLKSEGRTAVLRQGVITELRCQGDASGAH